ncbi:uncharacterized protein [Rutidosis leptorrhynchoides]|uniref:uncharacterized protein n=1 Tax=Rutidosis leptorrhynchoides TaxID=125765 RepID=UPI003A98D361
MGIADFETSAVWNWKRDPSGRVISEFEGLRELLAAVYVDRSKSDSWKWALSSNGKFSVKNLSVILDEQFLGTPVAPLATLRNRLVPKKLEIFVWRSLKGRLPVRLELDKRGIDLNSLRCPLCDNDLESVDHVLVSCIKASKVWERIFKWWKMGSFSNFCLQDVLGDCDDSTTSTKFGNLFGLP